MESGVTKNAIMAELVKSPHGKLEEYVPIVQAAARKEPEFLSHLIAWNRVNGSIRDAKVALPVVSLTVPLPAELAENSLAHMGALGPREFLKAIRFALALRPAHYGMRVKALIRTYLHDTENDRGWDRLAIQHRGVLRELYGLGHVNPLTDRANIVLFGRRLDKTKAPLPSGSIFETVARLKDMDSQEAASAIISRKIPFLIAMGALHRKASDTDLVLALITRMSPTEVVTNAKMLEKMGVKSNPALRGAFDEALKRAASSKDNSLKATRAAEAVEDDETREKLRGLQEKRLKSMGPEGNWLVLADKSSSMESAIEISRQVSATLAKMVKGKVWLVFFDTQPQTIDVTGLALDAIQEKTKYIRADGWTSIGCGLSRMLMSAEDIDGIAIVSDGQENRAPYFPDVYQQYVKKFEKEPPVYLYHCGRRANDLTLMMRQKGIDMQVFDIANNVDYYSLPNLVSTMRANRYSLLDEVMETKLLTLKEVFKCQEARSTGTLTSV